MIPRVQDMAGSVAVALYLITSVAIAQVPLQLRGTIESVSAETLLVKARDGTMTNVKLADDVHVFTLKKASLGDVKKGNRVGITARQQMDGSRKAVEIYVFPGDAGPESGGTASSSIAGTENEILSYIEGSVLDMDDQGVTINHKDREKISVPTNVRVVMLVPATVAEVKAGQYFLAPNSKQMSLGTVASAIIVGNDAVDFAM
jgi:hypothetical protein